MMDGGEEEEEEDGDRGSSGGDDKAEGFGLFFFAPLAALFLPDAA